ncbi:hypothetical protein ECTW00353_2182, partial [Escherichia coli TW00353]
MGIRFTA